jgi:hypothetical protein
VEFGQGADRLIINGAELNGAIRDSDANLTIDVTNGRIILTGSDSLGLTDATFNDGAVLEIQIDTDSRSGAFIDASGAVTFARLGPFGEPWRIGREYSGLHADHRRYADDCR